MFFLKIIIKCLFGSSFFSSTTKIHHLQTMGRRLRHAMDQWRWWWGPRGMTKKIGLRDVPSYVFFVWNCFSFINTSFFHMTRSGGDGTTDDWDDEWIVVNKWHIIFDEYQWMMMWWRMMGERCSCSILVFSSTTTYIADLEHSQYIPLVQFFYFWDMLVLSFTDSGAVHGTSI